jgi:hypothetical protein
MKKFRCLAQAINHTRTTGEVAAKVSRAPFNISGCELIACVVMTSGEVKRFGIYNAEQKTSYEYF